MKEFITFNIKDEIEIVNGIPSNVIRNGLSFLLLTILILIGLSSAIKVDSSIPIEAKIQSNSLLSIQTLPFGNVPRLTRQQISDSAKIDVVIVTRRSFSAMRDSLFILKANPVLKLYINITNTSIDKKLAIGKILEISINSSNATFKTPIKNIFKATDTDQGNTLIYELDTNSIPENLKYKLLSTDQKVLKGYIKNNKTTMLYQVWSNLFNKFKV